MNALVIGAGHLGTFLAKRLKVERHWDGRIDAISQEILDEFEMVINTAGKTSLEWCEKNPAEAFDCNVIQPLHLFRKIRDQIFVQFSSGCIWDGPWNDNGNPFFPGSLATPACFYSWTKVSLEALLEREQGRKRLAILRPRQVYSPLPSARNTLTKLRTYKKLIDTPNSMTSAETIAKTIEFISKNDFPTIMNVFDSGITSPYNVGKLMFELGLRDEPVLMSKSDLDKELVPKRVDAVIDDVFFSHEINPPSVELELRRVISEYKANLGA